MGNKGCLLGADRVIYLEKLYGLFSQFMQESVNADWEGYGGRVALDTETLDAIELRIGLNEIRKTARSAGTALGWKAKTTVTDERKFVVYDDREVPDHVLHLMMRARAARLDEIFGPMFANIYGKNKNVS